MGCKEFGYIFLKGSAIFETTNVGALFSLVGGYPFYMRKENNLSPEPPHEIGKQVLELYQGSEEQITNELKVYIYRCLTPRLTP